MKGGEKMLNVVKSAFGGKRFIPFLLGSGLFLAAGAVLAFSGTHSFLNVYTVSSDSHTSLSSYQATGSAPFDGQGNYDGSRINLKGTLTVSEQDGVPVNPPTSFCVKVQGKINSAGQGSATVTRYKDLSCKKVANQGTYAVSGYTEDANGAFNLQYQDSAGVVTTASGTHTYSR